jgi:hypothetical protein
VSSGVREIQPLEQKCLLSGSSVAQFDEALQPFIITDSSGNIQYNALGSQDLSSLSPAQQQQLLYGPWQQSDFISLSPPINSDIGQSDFSSTDLGADGGDDYVIMDGGGIIPVDGDMMGDDYGIDHTEGGGGIIPVDGDTMGDDYGYDIFGDADMPLPDGGTDAGDDVGADTGAGVDGQGDDPKIEIEFKDLEDYFLEGPYSRSKLDRAKLRFERTSIGSDPLIAAGMVTLKFTGTAKLGQDYGLADAAGDSVPLVIGTDGSVQLELNTATGIDTFYLVSRMDGDYELDESAIITIVGVSTNAQLGANKEVSTTLMDFTGDVDLNATDEDTEDKPGVDIAWNNDDDNLDKKPDFIDPVVDLADDDLAELSFVSFLLSETDCTPWAQFSDYLAPTVGYFVLDFDPTLVRLYKSDGTTVISGTTIFGSNARGLKAEAIRMGTGSIDLRWVVVTFEPDPQYVYDAVFDTLRVNVWGIDADVDSDNNQGFDLPLRSPWEDYLENEKYAIGKMLSVNDPEFTPVVVQLPRGLDPADRRIKVSIDFHVKTTRSGSIDLWNTQKANVIPGPQGQKDITKGGNHIDFASYSLSELGYSSVTGTFVIWMRATQVTDQHDTKVEIDLHGKPEDSLSFTVGGVDNLPDFAVKDEVKYMVVKPHSFYPVLNNEQPIRNAFAAEMVYGQRPPDGSSEPKAAPKDDPRWALKLVTEDELKGWLQNAVVDKKIRPAHRERILAVLFGHEGPGTDPVLGYVNGMAAALYLDHCSGSYVLSFRGTNFTEIADWIVNLSGGLGSSLAHRAAQEISWALARTPGLWDALPPGQFEITGHSMGGGLASVGAVAARTTGPLDPGGPPSNPIPDIHSDTFNAAGVWEQLFRRDLVNEEIFVGSIAESGLAPTFINAYNVWHIENIGGTPIPDGSVPDILTWVQRQFNDTINLGVRLPMLADAIGFDKPVFGLTGFTEEEKVEFVGLNLLIGAIQEGNKSLLASWISGLLTRTFNFPTGIDEVRKARIEAILGKMADAHNMEHIFHGLMTGPGFNVYN